MLNALKVSALLSLVAVVASEPGVLVQIRGLENSNSPLLKYPTQYTQGIVPKYIHSHNDYWREVPLLTAISNGVASVEADLWLVNGQLYVGHERQALTPARTFDSLYIQPLLKNLQKQNPQDQFTMNTTTKNGVFDTSPGTTLQLLVDMKTDGTEMLPFVISSLKPLRDNGYLTTFENGTLIQGAVTVVGTGNTPLDGIKSLQKRDVFFDAPLTNLTNTTGTTFGPELSPVASTDYETAVGWDGITEITQEQQHAIQTLVSDANNLGIRARFWDTPGWPVFARENVWRTVLAAGEIWLNADDLGAAASF
ncbi:hypothetical protein AX17_007122 [Amanita inopinata Kibby_2008]|nr:hypothetical protein AX17_007122 [Amanita inopinata Kibby_2008]